MTVIERALCSLGLHAWLRVEGAGRVSVVCARNASHRRLLELTPEGEPPSATTTLELHLDFPAVADIPEDKITAPEAEIESAPATILADIPATPAPLVIPAGGRRGGPSKVPCANGYKLHKWRWPADADGWMRCQRGCGAGRSQADSAERVWPAESVPKLAKAAPVDDEDGIADEEIIFRPEPPATVTDLPIIDKSRIAGDEDDYGDFGDQAAVEAFETTSVEREPDEDPDDGEGIVRPRPGAATLSREQLAPLVGRADRVRVLERRAPCARCETGQYSRDPLEPDDPTAFACVLCGDRPRLSPEQAAALAKEMDGPREGKARRREPSLNGMKL